MVSSAPEMGLSKEGHLKSSLGFLPLPLHKQGLPQPFGLQDLPPTFPPGENDRTGSLAAYLVFLCQKIEEGGGWELRSLCEMELPLATDTLLPGHSLTHQSNQLLFSIYDCHSSLPKVLNHHCGLIGNPKLFCFLSPQVLL